MHSTKTGFKTSPIGRKNNFQELKQALTSNSIPLVKERKGFPGCFVLKGESAFADGQAEFVHISEDFQIVKAEGTLQRDFEINFKGEDWVRFNYLFSGKVVLKKKNLKTFKATAFMGFFHYGPKGSRYKEIYEKGIKTEWISIYLNRKYFEVEFKNQKKQLEELFKSFGVGFDGDILKPLPLPDEVFSAASKIFHFPRKNNWQLDVIKARALEIVALQLAALFPDDFGENFITSGEKIPSPIRKKLFSIKAKVDGSEYLSLQTSEIAFSNGFSPTTLCRHFKGLYHLPLGTYLHNRKMIFAFEYLFKNEGSLKQLTAILGYNYSSSLSTAIKRYFGISARAIKNMELIKGN